MAMSSRPAYYCRPLAVVCAPPPLGGDIRRSQISRIVTPGTYSLARRVSSIRGRQYLSCWVWLGVGAGPCGRTTPGTIRMEGSPTDGICFHRPGLNTEYDHVARYTSTPRAHAGERVSRGSLVLFSSWSDRVAVEPVTVRDEASGQGALFRTCCDIFFPVVAWPGDEETPPRSHESAALLHGVVLVPPTMWIQINGC